MVWCRDTAGTRMHGTICARPLEVFTADEQPRLLPIPSVYDVPVFKAVKVHRDFHAEVARRCTRCPSSGSAPHWTCAPTASW